MRDNGIEPTIIEYLKNVPTVKELESLSLKLKMRPAEFIRKGEADFKDNNVKEILNDDSDLFKAMNQFPKIIERPIVVNDKKAVMGRPPENVLDLL